MADSVKCTVTDGIGSYLDFGGFSLDDFGISYFGFQFFVPAATMAAWAGGAFNDSPLILLLQPGFRDYVNFWDSTSTGVYDEYQDAWLGNLPGDIAGGAWHKLEWLREPTNGPGPLTLTLDDSPLGSDTFAPSGTITDLVVGAFQNHGAAPATGEIYIARIKVGTAAGGSDIFDFDAATAPDLSAFTVTGTCVLDTAPVAPPAWSPTPPPPSPSRRFFAGYPWRFIVTDLNTETITFLDRLATGRQVTVGRNIAREARGLVPSDNPEINILHTDGDPFLDEGNRLVYGFRREGWNGMIGPWVCRFAGPLLHLEDNAQTDAPATPWIAMDPWALLYRRPVRLGDGDLPGPDGRVFLAADLWTYPEIAYQLLLDSITYDGTCFIDSAGGTIVAGPVIGADVTLQQGLSVGAAWDQLCATGKVDIELDPVYDPVGSPGVCCTFNAKPVIGVTQNAAIFAWDLPSRSLTDISRVIDGTGRANTIQYYFGQGGPPVSQQIDAASAAKYGEYWEQQFWPGFREAGPVSAMAARMLALVKDGIRTFTFAPAPERSPIPFDDYMPGDWAPFFASKKLRAALQPTLSGGAWTNIPRIESFTVDIADNQTETVNPLLVSMDIQP